MTTVDGKDITDTVRVILEKAFDSKAEAYTNLELANYFHRRELLPTLIHQREHHILRGRKGTGKSAILLYLSFPVQLHCSDISEANFIGFYLTFGANIPPPVSFDFQTERETGLLFGHWFNLYVCRAIIDSIITAKSEGFKGIGVQSERKLVDQLWTSFLETSNSTPSSLEDASSALDSFQSELRRILSNPALNKKKSLEEYSLKKNKYLGKVTDISEFRKVIEISQRTIDVFGNKTIFLLMDEYDSLSTSQQVIVNTAIAGSTGQYYAKIGVLSSQGLKDRGTITGLTLRDDQLKLVDLERFASYAKYEDFIRAAIEARIKEIHNKVSGIPELAGLFVDLNRLIPAKYPSDQLKEQNMPVLKRKHAGQLSLLDIQSKTTELVPVTTDSIEHLDIDAWWTLTQLDKIPTYCGIKTICFLSSGLIRTAIEITYTILREALVNHWDLIREAHCIPYDIQDSAIRQEASDWLRIKLLANIKGITWDGKEPLAEVASRLIGNLLRQFADTFMKSSKKLALNCFSIKEIRDQQSDGIRALQEGQVVGIFTQLGEHITSPQDSSVYSLHRIYSVRNNLPPIRTGCLQLSWDRFQEYCRSPRGQIGKQQEVKTTYFVGIGFRQVWENGVRQRLQENSPSSYIYSDGAGAHERSILVVGTVERKIAAARLCIFDITTQNENVYFEFGLAIAKRKPIRHLLNLSESPIKDLKKLPSFLQGIVVETYHFADDPSTDDLQSLEAAMGNITDWYEKYRRRRGHPCPIDDKCKFISTMSINNQVFIAAPEGSLARRCLPDLRRLIVDELQMQMYPTNTNVGPHYICDFCQAAGRSEYCIVDTTNCDPTYCGILGLCFGYGRKVLNTYEKSRSGLITNYTGQSPKEYVDKAKLVDEVGNFLQRGEEI